MNKEEIRKMVSNGGKKFVTENMAIIADHISNEIKQKLNSKLEKISKANIIRSVDNEEVNEEEDLERHGPAKPRSSR